MSNNSVGIVHSSCVRCAQNKCRFNENVSNNNNLLHSFHFCSTAAGMNVEIISRLATTRLPVYSQHLIHFLAIKIGSLGPMHLLKAAPFKERNAKI